jgi:hypothetical protein
VGNILVEAIPKGYGFTILDMPSKEYEEYWNGRLLVWEAPKMGSSYVLGVDPSEGVGQDRSVIEVIRRGDLYLPDEQVAEFTSDHHTPLELAPIVNAIGRFYKDDDGSEALAVIECNTMGGQDCQLMLRTTFDYSSFFIWKVYDKRTNIYTNKFGWWTSRSTRPKLIVRGIHAMQNGDLKINSPFLLDEMEDFEQDHFMAKAKARFGRHDDRVMAFLMAHVGAHDDEWLAGEDIAEQRHNLTRAGKVAQVAEAKTGSRSDFQNSPISFSDMMLEADERLFGEGA